VRDIAPSPRRRKYAPTRNFIRPPDAWLCESIRQLGSAADDQLPKVRASLAAMLFQHGMDFAALGQRIERIGINDDGARFALEGMSYEEVSRYFQRHADRIHAKHHLWFGGLLSRLKTKQEPSIDDRRRLVDVVAQVRLAAQQ
jgi:hypothetical protein